MAENDGALENKVANTSPLPVVYIAAAYACLRDVNADFMFVAELRDFAIFERDVFDSAEDKGWVLKVQSQPRLEVH